MKVEQWAVEKVIPYERNPRFNDGAVEATAKSIEAFGFRQPIVVDKAGVIIVGHTRLKAAQQLKLKKVPVHIAELSDAEAMAYRIADNKTGELAEWDEELLAGELGALEDLDFDLDLTGFPDGLLVDDDLKDKPPPKKDEDGGGDLADTNFTFGQYRFSVDRETYLKWQEDLRQQAGFDNPAAHEEIKRRLGL